MIQKWRIAVINYKKIFTDQCSKFKRGEILYAADNGIRKVSVKEVKIFASISNTIYICRDCITQESCAYNEHELFYPKDREKCLEYWMAKAYECAHWNASELVAEKQHNIGIISPHPIQGSRVLKISLALLNGKYIFTDFNEKCKMEESDNVMVTFKQTIRNWEVIAKANKAEIFDLPDRNSFPDMFQVDDGIFVDWKTYQKRKYQTY